MIWAEAPSPLDGLASAASVILIMEVLLILLLLAAIAILLALAMRWVHDHVVPLVKTYGSRTVGALGNADRGMGVLIERLADIYGRRQGAERFVRIFLAALFPAFFADPKASQDGTPPQP